MVACKDCPAVVEERRLFRPTRNRCALTGRYVDGGADCSADTEKLEIMQRIIAGVLIRREG